MIKKIKKSFVSLLFMSSCLFFSSCSFNAINNIDIKIVNKRNDIVKQSKESISSLQISGKNGESIEGKYEVKQNYSVVVTTIKESGNFVIEGTSASEVKEEIVVEPNVNASITLKNIKLFYSDGFYNKSPIQIDSSSNVNLIIEGDNSIRAPQNHPAIAFYGNDTSGTLTFSSDNDGYLYAEGGYNSAAIGGGDVKNYNQKANSGNIVFNSGRYKVNSGNGFGPAIGAGVGMYGDESYIDKIEINGGEIEAILSEPTFEAASAIGSGFYGNVGEIIINGGKILSRIKSSQRNSQSSAIGCGRNGKIDKITINNGDISTITDFGVGIGSSYSNTSHKAELIINGGNIFTTNNEMVVNSIGANDGNTDKVNYDIKINGGSINTNNFSTNPVNNLNNELSLLKLENVSSFSSIKVDEIDFNVPLIREDKSLYLYVSKTDHKLILNDGNTDINYDAIYIPQNNAFKVIKEGSEETPPQIINAIPQLTIDDITLKQGQNFSKEIAKTYASAYDEEEGQINDRIEIIQYDVDTSVPGTYHITFQVTDKQLAKSIKTITVIVEKMVIENTPPTIVAKDQTISKGFNLTESIIKSWANVIDQEDEDLNNNLEIIFNNVVTSTPGSYQITYKVTDKGGLSATKTINVIVEETAPANTAPEIIVENKEISLNFNLTDEIILNWARAYDNEEGDISEKLEIIFNNVNTSKVGTYQITYQVKDQHGLSSTETINVIVLEKIIPPTRPNNSNKTRIILLSTLIPLSIILLATVIAVLLILKKKKENKNAN